MPKIDLQSNQLKDKVPRNKIGAERSFFRGIRRLLLIPLVLSFIFLVKNLSVARNLHKGIRSVEKDDAPVVPDIYDDRPRQYEDEDELENKTTSTTIATTMTRNPSASNAVADLLSPLLNLSESTAGHHPIDELLRETQQNSLRILFNFMKHYVPDDEHGESITDPNTIVESARCQKFGFEYTGRKTRRRLFFGSMIADDSWHPIMIHAGETYGLYHSVALIESNATTSRDNSQSRKLRFTPNSTALRVLQSGIFGPQAKVTVEFYVDRPEVRNVNTVIEEDMQREIILHRWKENGMTVDDIGIIGDVDEFFSRDFLLAAMSCDIPEFRRGQDCRSPKLIGSTLVFEASPECRKKGRVWFHPDMAIGECIDTIGDSVVHKPGLREYKGNGRRVKGYGKESHDYSLMPNTTMFPLWKPLDFRSTEGGRMVSGNQTYSGFHLHNFFSSIKILRNKYATYGHQVHHADKIPLGKLAKDIHLTVNCVTERPDPRLMAGGFKAHKGPSPIVFQHLADYRAARHQEMKEIILKDEEKFGRHHQPVL